MLPSSFSLRAHARLRAREKVLRWPGNFSYDGRSCRVAAWFNNALQVINQYEAEGARSTRFDVTVLVNGLPIVHIELKRRGVDIREAVMTHQFLHSSSR